MPTCEICGNDVDEAHWFAPVFVERTWRHELPDLDEWVPVVPLERQGRVYFCAECWGRGVIVDVEPDTELLRYRLAPLTQLHI